MSSNDGYARFECDRVLVDTQVFKLRMSSVDLLSFQCMLPLLLLSRGCRVCCITSRTSVCSDTQNNRSHTAPKYRPFQ